MKLSIERNTLLKAVSHAQSVVERRNTIPILANVLIEAENDKVQFRATDLDVEIVDRVQAKVDRTGSTTVSAVSGVESTDSGVSTVSGASSLEALFSISLSDMSTA